MDAGKLNRRIQILRANRGRNITGEIQTSYEVMATTWAAQWQLSQTDTMRQQGMTSPATIKFLIRYREDVTNDMRIRYAGDDYQITEQTIQEDRVSMFLLARAV